MRAVVQRVSSAHVTVGNHVTGAINRGLLVLLGIQRSDTEADAVWLAQKVANLRIFEDDSGKMNVALLDRASPAMSQRSRSGEGSSAPVLVVSQFTLLASTRKGNRPSFNESARPEEAIPLYEFFVRQIEHLLACPVASGTFGAMMKVTLVNDGPVTLILDSRLRE